MAEKERLAGRIALVTGGAQGIGKGIAQKLAEHGARVVIADIQTEKGAAAAREIGASTMFVPLDVTNPDSWTAAYERIEVQCGGLDILVNNAGDG